MVRRAVALGVSMCAAALAAAGCGSAGAGDPPARTARVSTEIVRVPHARADPARAPDPETLPLPPGDLGAWIRRPVVLRSRPAGPVAVRMRPMTQWGSPVVMPIVRRSGRWVGVITTALPNGHLGWLRLRALTLVTEPVRLVVDLAARNLRVVEHGRTRMRMSVAVGAPATATPTGTYGVTDLLRLAPGSPYGCCALALSGHQPHIAQGWTGGDRLAIHGTSDPASVGLAVSHGCLRGYESDLRRLLRLTPLGARVVVRAA